MGGVFGVVRLGDELLTGTLESCFVWKFERRGFCKLQLIDEFF